MYIVRAILIAALCAGFAANGFAQTPAGQTSAPAPQFVGAGSSGFTGWFTRNYLPKPVKAVSWADSDRMDHLMRAGNVYLSLRDAIALALENNLDIENARFNLPQAEANMLRASAGQLLTNVSSTVAQGPSSASSGVLAGSGGFGAGASNTSSSSQSGVLSGLNVQLAGSPIPNLDPVLFSSGNFSHQTTPLTSSFASGTSYLVTSQKGWAYGLQKGFLTGTTATLYMNNTFGYWQNAPQNDFNPTTSATMSVQIQQNLLKGFRPSINNRVIRVAKNQMRVSDLAFKQQVMATVSNVVSLYWDLVTYNEMLRVRQQALALNTQLYEDNKRRAELGAIAPIDIIQAEAEMKAAEQDVRNAESTVLQQETILKSVLTRNGVANMSIVSARLVPTDHFEMPAQAPVEPVQDSIAAALRSRPDVEQNRIGLENTTISMLGTKDALLPTLSVTLSASNAGQAGQINDIPLVTTVNGNLVTVPHDPAKVNSFFLGGYGTALNQVFSRKFPSYSASFSLSVPIRNRSAQADLIGQELQYRQAQIQNHALENGIRVSVINNRTALTQAHAAWQSAVEARRLQEEIQKGTRRKYELGTATILDVVIVQQTTVARELSESTALNSYIHSRLNMQSTLGNILDEYGVRLDDARQGTVGRAPDLIPAIPTPPGRPR